MKCSFDIEKLRSHIRTNGKEGRSIKNIYYVPELNNWVHSSKIIKTILSLGLTPKEWFDKHFLLKDENENPITPVCEVCGKPLTFFNLARGYQMRFCSSKCTGKSQKEDKDFKIAHSIAAKKVWDREESPYRTKEYSNSVSKGLLSHFDKKGRLLPPIKLPVKSPELVTLANYFRQKERWSDPNSSYNSPEFRANLSNWAKNASNAFGRDKVTRTINPVSKVSICLFQKLSEILINLYGFSECDMYFGKSEYRLKISDDVNRNLGIHKKYVSMDFYIKSINRCIEFNGDYWHKNPEVYLKKEDELDLIESGAYDLIIDQQFNDYSRSAGIALELGMKDMPLTIWELDYNKDPLHQINRCIEYIMRGINYRDKSSMMDEIKSIKLSEDKSLIAETFYLNNSLDYVIK